MKHERRTFDVLELRVAREDSKPRIVGHAAVFNVMGDGGWFREKVAPGAFADSIKRTMLGLYLTMTPTSF